MFKNCIILIIAFLLLSACNINQATEEPIEINEQIATSVALTLAASVPETQTPVVEVVEAMDTATPSPFPTGDPTLLNTDYENALSIEMQVVIGTLKLDQSGQRITADQAALQLPLWKALRSILDSENIDSAQISAQITYILNTMTMDQVAAIAAMQLTREDMISLAETLGLEMMGSAGGFGGDGEGGPPQDFSGAGEGEGRPQGRGTGDGQGMKPETGQLSQDISLAFIDAVIELLSAKKP